MDTDSKIVFGNYLCFIRVNLWLKSFAHTFRDVDARHNRIAQRNTVTIMSGEKQIRRLGFNFVQQAFELSVADIVLRNRLWIKRDVLKCRLAFYTEQHS